MEIPISISRSSRNATPFATLRQKTTTRSSGVRAAIEEACPDLAGFEVEGIKNGLLLCSLGHRFDLKRAGPCPDSAQLHLDPLPLLVQDGLVKVAQAHATDTGHHVHAKSHQE